MICALPARERAEVVVLERQAVRNVILVQGGVTEFVDRDVVVVRKTDADRVTDHVETIALVVGDGDVSMANLDLGGLSNVPLHFGGYTTNRVLNCIDRLLNLGLNRLVVLQQLLPKLLKPLQALSRPRAKLLHRKSQLPRAGLVEYPLLPSLLSRPLAPSLPLPLPINNSSAS